MFVLRVEYVDGSERNKLACLLFSFSSAKVSHVNVFLFRSSSRQDSLSNDPAKLSHRVYKHSDRYAKYKFKFAHPSTHPGGTGIVSQFFSPSR